MAEVVTEKLLTGEEFVALGDIGPAELVEGRIVHMAPPGKEHNRRENRVAHALSTFVYAHGLGEVYTGETGIFTRRNPDTVRAADVVYISREQLARDDPAESNFTVPPELVVEVISPGDRWAEVDDKLREYFAVGVRLIWVVNPRRRVVHVYTSLDDMRAFGVGDTLTADDVLPGFALPVAEIFAE